MNTRRPASTRRRSRRPLLLALFLLAGCDPGPKSGTAGDASPPPASAPEPPRPLTPGHQKMLALLQEIQERTPDEHLYLGDKRARQLREQLAHLDPNASARKRSELHFQAGQAEVKLDNLEQAIEHDLEAYRLMSEAKVNPREANTIRFHLAVAYLRLGETQNCCKRFTTESCILPIRGGGLHQEGSGSKNAIRYLREILEDTSLEGAMGGMEERGMHLSALWLLNLAYMTLGGYPQEVPPKYRIPPSAFKSEIDFPRFINVAPKLGLDTFNLSGGAIADDFDNDDYLDLMVSTADTAGQMRFFRNNRDGTFSERTREANLTGLRGGLNMVQADYDNDGDLDLLVIRGAWLGEAGRHADSLLRNEGQAVFTDVTFEAGLGEAHYPSQTASWGDYDLDGDLDLYVGNEASPQILAPCQLFRNEGNGTFTDVAAAAGVTNLRFTKGVIWGDYDGDRYPDLYVSNLKEPNRLYHNDRNGTFTDVAPQLNVTLPIESFPTWFWDFDNDGVLDIFASCYSVSAAHVCAHYLGVPFPYEPPRLYRGNGRGGFEDVAPQVNLRYPMEPMGVNFGDLDNDGFLDFYLGTGNPLFESLMPNLMYLNREGRWFVDVTMAGGFGNLQKGHAIAFADFDNDGDSDIFSQLGGAFPADKYRNALFENPGFGNRWISVKLVGVKSNRGAIGARIRVIIREEGGTRSIYRHINSGGSFGANPLRQTLGLGKASSIGELEVLWPVTNLTQKLTGVPLDQVIQITEGREGYQKLELKKLAW